MVKAYSWPPIPKIVADVLILGRMPPPIGGVTIHVSRLIENLEGFDFNGFSFCDLGRADFWEIVRQIIRCKIIHLHISNPFFQAAFALFCRLFGKVLLITYHGNWGRYRIVGNWMVNLSAFFCTIPIVQTNQSLDKALFWNKKALLISTHLSAQPLSAMDNTISKALTDFKKTYKVILCTNAWNVTFDRDGREIYGIMDIIQHIQNASNVGLIVSDPSGNYHKYALKIRSELPENVLFISWPHDFRHVLCHSNAFIRNTTTDGVAISIHEAKELNVPILATNVVERPAFCLTFGAISDVDFERDITLAGNLLEGKHATEKPADPFKKIIQLYRIYTGCE